MECGNECKESSQWMKGNQIIDKQQKIVYLGRNLRLHWEGKENENDGRRRNENEVELEVGQSKERPVRDPSKGSLYSVARCRRRIPVGSRVAHESPTTPSLQRRCSTEVTTGLFTTVECTPVSCHSEWMQCIHFVLIWEIANWGSSTSPTLSIKKENI